MTITIPYKSYATFIDADGAEHIEEVTYFKSINRRPTMLLFLTKSGIYIFAENDEEIELGVLPKQIRTRIHYNHFYKYKHSELDMENFLEWNPTPIKIENSYDWFEVYDVKEVKLSYE